MSWNPALEPGCPDEVGVDAIDTLIVPRSRDLGGFEVRRALPAPKRQMVGPFIFFDQAGPAELLTGQGVDVRPHPHIGLGTVTYLYRGDFHHRDSTGADQIILPGELNWMVAGRGFPIPSGRLRPRERVPIAFSGSRLGWPCRKVMKTWSLRLSITKSTHCR